MFSSPRNAREDGAVLEESDGTLDIWPASAAGDEA